MQLSDQPSTEPTLRNGRPTFRGPVTLAVNFGSWGPSHASAKVDPSLPAVTAELYFNLAKWVVPWSGRSKTEVTRGAPASVEVAASQLVERQLN